ncbi:MAG TPA: TylF/MycF/NovP-related O-methyltransferase [Micropepsaceae bacterium]|nr:TylF/MycF/NovP-related O-methyltransferase [Micropepsaceae bacterium]
MVDWGAKLKRELTRPFRALSAAPPLPLDLSPFQKELVAKVRPYTMTSPERIAVLEAAVRHVIGQNYPGSFVECGVAKGGSTMAMAYTLKDLGVSDRDLYLYDTFEGMPEPDEVDRGRFGESAAKSWRKGQDRSGGAWIRHGVDEVRANLSATGYPEARLHFIKGKVEETLPKNAPEGAIALLRLDTDWHASTKAELDWLYPKLVRGGIVIVDDYFRWQGARKAVDDYVALHKLPIFFSRIDDASVIAVKP